MLLCAFSVSASVNVSSGKATRIFFTNGEIDPWHVLGITKNETTSLPAYLMPPTAHCADLYPPRSIDAPILTSVRAEFLKTLDAWLKM